MIIFIHSARILRRNNDRALYVAVAHVLHRPFVVVVINGKEGANIGAHRIKRFADLQSLRAAVLIDDAEFCVANLSSKGVTQDDELNQGEDHGHHHECR